jgi:hypothetical protein
MPKIQFQNEEIYKPVTDTQYESLANEMLIELNKLADPQVFEADFIGAIFANAIHSVDLKGGLTTKTKIFEVMVDLIAKRLSFEISEGIRHKKEAEAKAKEESTNGERASDIRRKLKPRPKKNRRTVRCHRH